MIVESCVGGFMAYQVHEYVGDLEYGGAPAENCGFRESCSFWNRSKFETLRGLMFLCRILRKRYGEN